jgi:hypothetical protein
MRSYWAKVVQQGKGPKPGGGSVGLKPKAEVGRPGSMMV